MRTRRWTGLLGLLLVLGLCWMPEAQAEVRTAIIATGVTTDTTTTAVRLEQAYNHNAVEKTFYAQVVGTGAVTQTVAIYGDLDADAANGILLCTITLSGTTRAQDACPTTVVHFPYYYAITTNTTGTGATGGIYALYTN